MAQKISLVYTTPSEMRHSRSEDLLGAAVQGTSRSTSPTIGLQTTAASEDDLIAASALRDACNGISIIDIAEGARLGRGGCVGGSVTGTGTAAGGGVATGASGNSPASGKRRPILPTRVAAAIGVPSDRIDPEDSIRDIVTENDLYRFVLFKRHYDKYIALAAKYEEAKGVAYYLEERYHEVKAERDKLEEARRMLEKRLEGCEVELQGKEEELFSQLERTLRLEEEVERAKAERDNCIAARDSLDQQRDVALRRLHLQLEQNETTRRSLERARLDVIRQTTVIQAERNALEKENETLKEQLRIEQVELVAERRLREEDVAALTRETITLRHAARHLRAATIHATSCRRRRRCSVCLYARRTFAEVEEYQNNGNLFKCLQAPLQDLRTWFRPCVSATTSHSPETTLPLGEQDVNFIDDSSVDSSGGSSSSRTTSNSRSSSSSSNSASDDEAYPTTPVPEISLSSATSTAQPTVRAFSSDSGFSSEIGDRRLRCFENGSSSTSSSSGKSRKISDSLSCGEPDCQGTVGKFNRSKWTSSFRKLLGRRSKAKSKADRSS